MQISYQSGNAEDILERIREQLGGRKLSKILEFDLQGDDLRVTIRKMGSSHLHFVRQERKGSLTWELQSEKIALAHRAFKDEVMEKIIKIIMQTGGSVKDI
ncbi:MAG: hypothetical protein H6618_06925 [Deltaproteobacteria bacterium]|nr:hypothetical protein [Deltaproteobacteria bacterium]